MTHIVITGIGDCRNRGVEALAVSIAENMRGTFEDAKVTVLVREGETAKPGLELPGVEIGPDMAWSPPLEASALDKLKFRARRFLRRNILGKLNKSERILASADLVVVSGGDVFSSDYGAMERYLRFLDLPLEKGIPVYFFAQSIGPFRKPEEAAAFAAAGRRCHHTVREVFSLDYLVKDLKIPAGQVELTADPAFLLTPPEDLRARLLAEHGLEPGGYACAAASRGITKYAGLDHAAHVTAWIEAVKVLLERAGKVVLIPHVQIPDADGNDMLLAREVKAAFADDPRVVLIEHFHTATGFKAFLGAASFVVAERTHAAIGAMSSGVPTLSIGYSVKAKGVLEQLVKDEEVFASSLMPVEDFGPGAAGPAVAKAFDLRERFAADLAANLPDVKARSRANFDVARRLVEGRARR